MFSLWCVDWVGSLYANRIFMYFCIKNSIGTRVKLASCKSALTTPQPHPVVYSTDRSKVVVPVLLLCVLFYEAICFMSYLVSFCSCVFRSFPRLGKRELILVLLVRMIDLCLFGFLGFLFLLVSGKGCGLWLWHSLEFSLTFFLCVRSIKTTWLFELQWFENL